MLSLPIIYWFIESNRHGWELPDIARFSSWFPDDKPSCNPAKQEFGGTYPLVNCDIANWTITDFWCPCSSSQCVRNDYRGYSSLTFPQCISWLVVWLPCFPIYWVSNHSNWRTIFFRGVAQPPTSFHGYVGVLEVDAVDGGDGGMAGWLILLGESHEGWGWIDGSASPWCGGTAIVLYERWILGGIFN